MNTAEAASRARSRVFGGDALRRYEEGDASPQDADVDASTDLLLTPEQRKSVKVLVVDDEDTILDSSVSVLEHEGYHVRGVDRGSEADGYLREGTADIVLVDLYMSGVSGSELLRTALKARPDAIVIVITGRPSVESSVQSLRDGAWDYLPKPFSATQLRVLVGRAAHTVIVTRESRAASSQSHD